MALELETRLTLDVQLRRRQDSRMSPEDRRRFVQIVGQVLIADGMLGGR